MFVTPSRSKRQHLGATRTLGVPNLMPPAPIRFRYKSGTPATRGCLYVTLGKKCRAKLLRGLTLWRLALRVIRPLKLGIV